MGRRPVDSSSVRLHRKSKFMSMKSKDLFPFISTSLSSSSSQQKAAGLRSFIAHCHQMESEVSLLKKQAEESRAHSRSLKEAAKVRKDKTRQLLVACACKLEEKEAAIQQMKNDHDDALALIARELAFLRANMLKEQKRLEAMVAEKSRALEQAAHENERLRKLNKKLLVSSSNMKANKMNSSEDMDTPSSEDSSPKSSFLSKVNKMEAAKPSLAVVPKRPPPPPPVSMVAAAGPKPPVPSRAGVDKLLCKSPIAPQPPVRTTSLTSIGVERADSGRESDADHTTTTSFKRQLLFNNQDEGFFSSHEDGGHHRSSCRLPANPVAALRPSEAKFRGKLKATSTSNLAVLEEHQVTDGSQFTTVTYWTEPYL